MLLWRALRTAMTCAPTSTVRASITSRLRSVIGLAATKPNMAMKNTEKREMALKNCIVADLERMGMKCWRQVFEGECLEVAGGGEMSFEELASQLFIPCGCQGQ
jgi:hypothetical protein